MDSPLIDLQLFHRGAEADLYLTKIGPWKAVEKRRVSKTYRIMQLDQRIRKERTIREAAALSEVKKAGVRAPTVLSVDLEDYSISMSYLEGEVARTFLDRLPRKKSAEIFREIGRQIGQLHKSGLVHGDMTTSNLIVSSDDLPYILDFGMSSHSTDPEDRGTDLHLLNRSISTSHLVDWKWSEGLILRGYMEILGEKEATLSVRKQREIARRGRYFAIR